MRVEQDVNLVFRNKFSKILGQPQDEVLLTTDRQLKHYKANEDRISLKVGPLFWKYCGETGNVQYYQRCIRIEKSDCALQSLLGEFGKHPEPAKPLLPTEKFFVNRTQHK